ncbi:MAG: ATP-binding protein [Bacteroidales bacterium]|jgi:ABC-type molybdenum transport system ATPase subunit/photorepair protein PhrA
MKTEIKDLRAIIGNIPIKRVCLEDETLHEIFIAKGSEAVKEKLNDTVDIEYTEIADTSLPTIETPTKEEIIIAEIKQEEIITPSTEQATDTTDTESETIENKKLFIEFIYNGKLLLRNELNNYFVLGSLPMDLSTLRITLIIEEKTTGRKERTKIDLYERESIRFLAEQLSNIFYQNHEQVETELLQLADELEKYREQQLEQIKNEYKIKRNYLQISPEKEKQIIEFLKSPNLISNIDKLIEQAGVVGEENTRKLLFIIASTYKMNYPLHSLIQGTSGSGKSHLINTIGECFPPEDVMSMTRVTSKSFYHYTREELVDKLMLIQDYDGLDEEAQYAFRELQSAGIISSSTIYKDQTGNLVSAVKVVKSHFASLLATTKAEIYYDSMSRSIIIGVDESEEQTQKIIEYQNKILSGIIEESQERKAKVFLQNCIRCIKSYEVVNPYADKIKLPTEAKMLRRLNNHYQAFIKQLTILHQYQRRRDDKNRLISEPEDLKMACEILFDAIMLKVDDLDSSLRQFFDKLKEYIKKIGNGKLSEYQFTQREIRLALNLSKGTCFRNMEDLEMLEYIQKTGGYANKGFKYKIIFFDDMEKIRTKIKDELNKQLEQLIKNNTTVGS